MQLIRSGEKPSTPGRGDYFSGAVRMDMPFSAPAPARVGAVVVTFEPGARTNWHTHPLGQLLIVTAGLGRAATEGGAVIELRAGDMAWFAPGEKHWHGAGPDTAMTHIAIHEALDGETAVWLEPVSEADYGGLGRGR